MISSVSHLYCLGFRSSHVCMYVFLMILSLDSIDLLLILVLFQSFSLDLYEFT